MESQFTVIRLWLIEQLRFVIVESSKRGRVDRVLVNCRTCRIELIALGILLALPIIWTSGGLLPISTKTSIDWLGFECRRPSLWQILPGCGVLLNCVLVLCAEKNYQTDLQKQLNITWIILKQNRYYLYHKKYVTLRKKLYIWEYSSNVCAYFVISNINKQRDSNKILLYL